MSVTKPTDYADWVTDGDSSKIDEPTGSLKSTGYTPGVKPSALNHNWLFYIYDQWIKWLEACSEYDAIIGANGSHANFAALYADANIANLRNILVIDKFTAQQIIASGYNGKRYTFKRGAGVDPTTGTALIVQSEDNEIIGYTAHSGSLGLQFTSTAKNNLLMNYRCLDTVTTEYQDDDTTESNSVVGMVRGSL